MERQLFKRSILAILCDCRLQFCDAIGSAERLADLEDAEPQSIGLGFAGLGFAGGSSIAPSSDGSMPGDLAITVTAGYALGCPPDTAHSEGRCGAEQTAHCNWLNKGRRLHRPRAPATVPAPFIL